MMEGATLNEIGILFRVSWQVNFYCVLIVPTLAVSSSPIYSLNHPYFYCEKDDFSTTDLKV